jgi:putative transposase
MSCITSLISILILNALTLSGALILLTFELRMVLFTLNVLWTYLPLIIHSDRGSQYVSNAWREATEKMQRSYSHSGYPYENACIESFHSLIKREWLNRFNIINHKHAYRFVFEYIETFYNTVRIHSHCDYMSPNDFEKLYERVSSLPAA